MSGLPYPSTELSHVFQMKAWVAWLLEWGAMREAGFTEQRIVSALCSGRIMGQCFSSSIKT
ncbi:hypothetical protein KY290_025441 [Solanum tuberosum]|uniref:Uncharacterized protein n=1 Tax=Solanum tuberosum TaxID=4113 RepID=A0ABQ7UTL6_SOLTU|nr:hypothetical protein KY290_025441 [Solanum tuberosum]